MLKNAFTRTLHTLGARDPARERLRKLLSVSSGIVGSVLLGYGVIHFLHADGGLLVVSVLLSMMTGLFVRDSTARDRVVTTALLIPLVVLVPLGAASLSSERPLQLIAFSLVSGIAVWIRRYGPRATTIGTLGFFVLFFTLFLRPTTAELPEFCLIAAGAVASQLVVKLVQWVRRHPEHELGVLLGELRVACAAAIEASASAPHQRTMQARLARIDVMWHAIAAWQQSFRTANYTEWDQETLAEHVLDACVNTEEACIQLARETAANQAETSDRQLALSHTLTALDGHASRSQLEQAASWAESTIARENPDGAWAYRLAECVLAHTRLRTVTLHRRPPVHAHGHGHGHAAPSTKYHHPASDPPHPDPHDRRAGSEATRRHLRWTPWREWAPTSRLAVQAMTATAIASAVGEAISASRWYWAVLTAFLVFVSTTTRSGILTRAYRRIIGTALGLLVGIAATYLAHDIKIILVVILLLSVMGMIYFGPLNYTYISFFVTVMLVALYAILGILDRHLLELRLEETIAGAAIGVLCAYLLLSATSRPALRAKIDAYFDALDALLSEGADLAASPRRDPAMIDRVHAMEAAKADLDETISAMSTAFLIVGRDRVDSALTLTHRSARSSARFAQIIMTGAANPETAAALVKDQEVLQDAVAGAREAAERARRQIEPSRGPDSTDRAGTPPQTADDRSSQGGDETVAAALVALDRFTWVMERLSEVLEPSSDRPARSARAHAL